MPKELAHQYTNDVPMIKDILARLGEDLKKIRKRNDAADTVSEDADNEEFEHPLETATEYLRNLTSINADTLKDAAFRINTPLGLSARYNPKRPIQTRLQASRRENDFKRPDLNWILPTLHQLDGAGENMNLLGVLFHAHPSEMVRTGFDKSFLDRNKQDTVSNQGLDKNEILAICNELNPAHRELLQAMHNLEAFDHTSLRSQQEIADEASPKTTKRNNFKAQFKRLSELNLTKSNIGRSGGCYLTATGMRVVDYLKSTPTSHR